MSAETELREFFREHGMNPSEIRHNESLDVYQVTIGVDGTDDEYLESVTELGSGGPVTDAIDTGTLKRQARRLRGEQIESGEIDVVDTMRDAHFRIKIE